MKNTLATLLCALVFNTMLTAQIKQGFKLLDQKDYENAYSAFQKDLANPEKSIVAGFGLIKAAKGLGKPDVWIQTIGGYEKTYKSLEALKTEELKKLNSAYQINKTSLEIAYNALFDQTLKHIESTPNTQKLRDDLEAAATIIPRPYKSRFNQLIIQQKNNPAITRTRMDPAKKSQIAPALVNRKAPEGTLLEFVSGVNTAGSEYIPVLTADGKTMYFVGFGRADNYAQEDVFYTERQADGSWSTPKIEEFFSGPMNEAVVSISADGNNLALFIEGKPYLSHRIASGWSEPMPIMLPKKYAWIGMVSITRNGEALIFESKESALSDIELCVALRKKNGDWEMPFNIGSPINTPADDRTPFLHSDFKTLYFSSGGHPGQGGLDVYKSTRLDDTWKNWSTPTTLGPSVNTQKDEYGFCIPPAGNVAYLATRTKGVVDLDIMRIPLDSTAQPEAQVVITGTLLDGHGKPVSAQLTVEEALTQKRLQTVNTQPNGYYAFSVPKTAKINYYVSGDSLVSTKKTYVDASTYAKEVAEEKVDFVTVKEIEKEGKALELQDLLFDFAKSDLRPEAQAELRRVYQDIKAFNWTIEVGGHTDNIGSEQSNLLLSARRAQAVRDFLVSLGYPADKISFKGYGPLAPVTENNTEAGRARNRRVEIKLKQ